MVITSGSVPVCSHAEHLAGAAEAGDHLVGDQQRAVLVRESLHAGQELRRRDDVARRALHGLDDDRGDRAGGRHLELLAREVEAGDAAVGIRRA